MHSYIGHRWARSVGGERCLGEGSQSGSLRVRQNLQEQDLVTGLLTAS